MTNVYGPDTCVFIPHTLNSVFGLGRGSCDLPLGVKYVEHNNRFLGQAGFQGKKHYLGTFTTPAEAHFAWARFKAQCIRFHDEEYKRHEGYETGVASNVEFLATALENLADAGVEFKRWKDLLEN